jgi:predicted extracellular nuclease
VLSQHLRHQHAETSRAEDRSTRPTFNSHLFDDAAGGSRGLDENGGFVVERIGHCVQIGGWKREVLGKRTIAAADADHGPDIAVSASCRAAAGALATADGDFADNTTPYPLRRCRVGFFDHPDELVAGNALETRIAAQQLEVGAADAGGRDTNQAFRAALRLRSILKREGAVTVEHKGAHRERLPRRSACRVEFRPARVLTRARPGLKLSARSVSSQNDVPPVNQHRGDLRLNTPHRLSAAPASAAGGPVEVRSTTMSHRISILVLTSFLTTALGVVPSPAFAQSTDLFFSEYIEGSSNNKALEIFNGTGVPVDLAAGGYTVTMHFNGNPNVGLTIPLAGVVAPGDVFVLAQSAAGPEILAVADQTNGAGWFNGDDAVILRKGSTALDVIGQIGFDPGTEWGTGSISTADNTLRRHISVTTGDPVGTDPFDPSVEWVGFANNTFDGLGCHNDEPSCAITPAVAAEIWEIQGSELASPFAGTRVRTSGVVTAVFTDGFFIQAAGAGDGNAGTSDGLFVFTGRAPTVNVGDEAEVTGRVTEFFNMTEIEGAEVIVARTGLPLPARVTLDAARPSPNQPLPPTDLEPFEGMLVSVVNGTASSPTNEFNEVSVVAGSRRAFREPGILAPGLPGLPVWDGNPEIFEVDTDRFASRPGMQIASGATVTAEGPLAFSFSDYQIWPTALAVVGGEAAVAPVRARNAGEFTVGSQNVLRLFDLEDDPDNDDDEEEPSAQQHALKLAKLSLQIRQALGSPDVLALQEVESLLALQDLAARIHSDDPGLIYTPYLLEGNDIGGIDVGFLVRNTVRVDAIEQLGKDDVFELDGSLLNDRPPLLLRGAYVGNGAPFPIAVINVHQRSLNGIEGSTSGAARVRQKRHQQALRLAEFIETTQTATPGIKLIVVGDFNAFEFTDGYVDVMGQVTGNPDPAGALIPASDTLTTDLTNQTVNMPAGERYSFVFDGSAQSLDHALTSQSLDRWLRGVQHSRGNADAPAAFDRDATTALRSSDHDGTVVFVMSDADADGVADDQDACAGTVVPEAVPLARLAEKRFALVNDDLVFDTPPSKELPPAFTLDDTRGCSCGQILDTLTRPVVGERTVGCTADTLTTWISSQP